MGLIFLFALVLAFALWWWQTGLLPFWESASTERDTGRYSRRVQPPETPEPLAAATSIEAPEATTPEFPLPLRFEELRSNQPLPPLDRSDGPILEALTGSFRTSALANFVNMQDYVRRLVVTVDNLPRELVPSQMSMVQRIPGPLEVQRSADAITLSPANFARYDAFVGFAQALDPRLLVDLYLRFYPLLDRTYKDIGYPNSRFHDRVIAAIDDMTRAPEPSGPIELLQPKVLFRYADPALQKLSAGQKIMIRVGPGNADQLKRVLRRLRAELLGQPVG